MRGSKADVPVTLTSDEIEVREIEWADMHVGLETYHQEIDLTPLMKGLPDDRCQCPHWGYIIRGRMRVHYGDREEVVNAGDAYYLAPGHLITLDAGTDLVEFSPREAYQRTMEVAARNFAALQQA